MASLQLLLLDVEYRHFVSKPVHHLKHFLSCMLKSTYLCVHAHAFLSGKQIVYLFANYTCKLIFPCPFSCPSFWRKRVSLTDLHTPLSISDSCILLFYYHRLHVFYMKRSPLYLVRSGAAFLKRLYLRTLYPHCRALTVTLTFVNSPVVCSAWVLKKYWELCVLF